ncbi:N-acetyltransferase [Pseudoxanthomonas winnipegensis]|uniref:N-acetyltransferase n=1 Tax=Pseudoxanthomonas winnipegensis TaxID=2480810 RepID=A0A4Q8LJX4_9GAMM|nr:N-acetyltransferase [Pseudoxanthomonas winnipegensis]TAA30002.1 N-acetyltransferase [Pseudoxanthomonas winnipegensis]TBV78144.1 N-acetyltransferase [Pseudoxanthomonas winnipegensis]
MQLPCQNSTPRGGASRGRIRLPGGAKVTRWVRPCHAPVSRRAWQAVRPLSQGQRPVPDVQHDPAAGKFFLDKDGQQAELEYRRHGAQMVITHTFVPDALRNRGLASELVRAALDLARNEGLKVVPVCSYSADFLQRHPEYADLRA